MNQIEREEERAERILGAIIVIALIVLWFAGCSIDTDFPKMKRFTSAIAESESNPILAPERKPFAHSIQVKATDKDGEYCLEVEGAGKDCRFVAAGEEAILVVHGKERHADWVAWSSLGDWSRGTTQTVKVESGRRRAVTRP